MGIDKSKMLDSAGRPLTQSLFLEIGYTDFALFTLKDEDHVYEGKTFFSLKKLYLEMEDPTEYAFANAYLLGWRHWKRLGENKVIRKHIDEWREELELKLRAKGASSIMKAAKDGSFNAAKWLADKGWEMKTAGRPSKSDIEREAKFAARVDDEFKADVVRLYGA